MAGHSGSQWSRPISPECTCPSSFSVDLRISLRVNHQLFSHAPSPSWLIHLSLFACSGNQTSRLLFVPLPARCCEMFCSVLSKFPRQNLVAQSCAPERKETCLWPHRQKQSQEELECPQAMVDTSPCRHTVGTHRGLCRCHWSNQTPSPSAARGVCVCGGRFHGSKWCLAAHTPASCGSHRCLPEPPIL